MKKTYLDLIVEARAKYITENCEEPNSAIVNKKEFRRAIDKLTVDLNISKANGRMVRFYGMRLFECEYLEVDEVIVTVIK
jgi:PHD/YefM family antitoxin component YafN of YafNO toxin-antitoxin module